MRRPVQPYHRVTFLNMRQEKVDQLNERWPTPDPEPSAIRGGVFALVFSIWSAVAFLLGFLIGITV